MNTMAMSSPSDATNSGMPDCQMLTLFNAQNSLLQESLEYKDHSHVWVCVPEISRLAFHPFSVITCPDADPSWSSSILLQSKVAGKWTKVWLLSLVTCFETRERMFATVAVRLLYDMSYRL